MFFRIARGYSEFYVKCLPDFSFMTAYLIYLYDRADGDISRDWLRKLKIKYQAILKSGTHQPLSRSGTTGTASLYL